MAERYFTILRLARETERKVISSAEEWTGFLASAGRFSKYPFEEQMLIHAQRPDASACAPVWVWDTFGCWINKGAKGIALIDTDALRPKLKYVFDMADVTPVKEKNGILPYLWSVKPEHEQAVIEALENVYGKTDAHYPFRDRIAEMLIEAAKGCYEDAAREIAPLSEGSLLEASGGRRLAIKVFDTVATSALCAVMNACGMEHGKGGYLFPYIREFNTTETLHIIGTAVNGLVRPMAAEIGKAVRTFELRAQKEAAKARQGRGGKGKNILLESAQESLAKHPGKDYNAFKHESEGQETAGESGKERGDGHGTGIQAGRGLSDTGYRDGRATGRGTAEVRPDEEKILKGAQAGTVFSPLVQKRTDEASVHAPRAGRGADGADCGTDGKGRRGGRGSQSQQSNALGTENEQHQAFGRGDYPDRNDILLNHTGTQQNNGIEMPGSTALSGILVPEIYEQMSLFPDMGGQAWEQAAGKGTKQFQPAAFQFPEKHLDSLHIEQKENPPRSSPDRMQEDFTMQDEIDGVRNLTLDSMESYGEKKQDKEKLCGEQAEAEEPETQAGKSRAQAGETVTRSDAARTAPVNFRIKSGIDDAEDAGKGFAPKEKFRQNIEAVRTLEKIEGENRAATPQEQETLSRYAGWGGLADAFDGNKAGWAAEYRELKELLPPEEYAFARASTLTAFYTSPLIIQCIYEAVARMGFTAGNILEPSSGIGNFFGMLPEGMQRSRLYGTEIDSLTGRIARQLYPEADIKIMGFEKADYPDDFFDLAVGNVPFGQFGVADRAYDRHNFLIHDYFFAKTLDKLRPGGVMALITSKGTLDKQAGAARKYLAQKAELLGAVRLPNTAFCGNAGTEITSDILFFKKLDRAALGEPEWVNLGKNADGIEMNQYFIKHPEMVLGRMEMVSGAHGMEAVCLPDNAIPLQEQLRTALLRIEGSIEPVRIDEMDDKDMGESIPADPSVKNYSYAMAGERLYYRENSIMKPVDVTETAAQRIKGMMQIRDCTQSLINLQLEEYPESIIMEKQADLNRLYDAFSEKYGLINSAANRRAFRQDSGYCLLCSLEKLDAKGNMTGKADMFTKRTIKRHKAATSVETASEALAVSLSEKASVDLAYMAALTGKSEETVSGELAGIIFQNPVTEKWETADEYLSGNVREKLAAARAFAKSRPEYAVNVASLEKAQPRELDASEIEVRIGAAWVKTEYIEDFMRDVFQTPDYLLEKKKISVRYSSVSGQWGVAGKNADAGNALANSAYGTGRANAYRILEDSLNLRDTRIYDTITDAEGREKRVLNKNETMLAGQKQEAVREAFKDWVFRDMERRQDLCRTYNELFNSTRPREYDGSHLKFPGMTQDITLKPHQLNAVAHQLYGNNTLLAHCVGAGKTFEMAAAAMECRRLGLCHKSLFVVPNHLTEQWAADFLRLYPGADILAAVKKDFEPASRRKFCSRIATGGYDAVIIGHTQFEKIPLSTERQAAIIEQQINEIETAISAVKEADGERYTIKQMEKTKKSLAARLERLYAADRKDDVVTFEQLGVDRLFVDESHNYKNLFHYTKMRNVAGIAQSEAQKSSDMFAKCQYLDEITGGRGVTFATGTPISNSMTELYTNMRYLQYSTLQRLGLGHFDSWASSFGETVTAVELAPEGSGYRVKTRFARFFNLPELMSIFKECADIQTADMLKLPVPEVEYENVVLKPTEYQMDIVQSLAERAEKVRGQEVKPETDNMLKITNDGRKLALDQRLINPLLPDDGNSKANACADNVYRIWKEHSGTKAAQLIFSDLSTPAGKKTIEMKKSADGAYEMDGGQFENVYDDLRRKLMQRGIPAEEICFIHEASTDVQKKELFAKVRSGEVRVLLGSTQKMGAGTNVQDRLIALHHLDVPWRPSDIEQREGRIIRQGNQCPSVKVFRYITENTFDSYSWQIIENKQKFIGQIMTGKAPVRSCEDIDEAVLTFAEIKALATGNPLIREKMELDMQVSRLKLLKANHASQQYRLEDSIAKKYPQQITLLKERIAGFTADIEMYMENKPGGDMFSMTVEGRMFTEKKEAGAVLLEASRKTVLEGMGDVVGEYMGFQLRVDYDYFASKLTLTLKGSASHEVELGQDVFGNLQRIGNVLEGMGGKLAAMEQQLVNVERQFETAKEEVKKPFTQEQELAEKLTRLSELNALLNVDGMEGKEGVSTPAKDQGPESCMEAPEKRSSVLGKLKEMQKVVSKRDAGKEGMEKKRENGMEL